MFAQRSVAVGDFDGLARSRVYDRGVRRSVDAIGVVLLFGACAGSPEATPPASDPEPVAAPEAEPPVSEKVSDEHSTGTMMGPDAIKLGVDKLNPGIKACGQQLGLGSGAKIMVRFVIESSGAIAVAEVLPPTDTELVACVAKVIDAAGPTVFPSFAAAEQQFQFNFRVP